MGVEPSKERRRVAGDAPLANIALGALDQITHRLNCDFVWDARAESGSESESESKEWSTNIVHVGKKVALVKSDAYLYVYSSVQ